MTQAEQKLSATEDYFRKCMEAWEAAHFEGQKAYGIWQAANEKRSRLAVEKNNAWGDLEMAQAAVAAERRTPGEEAR